jgi:phosphoserine phosphatase
VSRAGGKPAVIESLVGQFGFKKIAMIGDGATDLEAKSDSVTFIAFTEHVKRDVVVKDADFEMTSF